MIVKIGNWFFNYRNYFFVFLYATLFLPSVAVFNHPAIAVILGSLIIGAGILVRSITIGLVYIIRGGSKHQIHAEQLVTEGVYKVCRNPMYLGNLLLILGFGVFANSLLFLLIFFPLFLFIYHAIIKAEEHFLSGKFGWHYVKYKMETNALLPSFKALNNLFAGNQFNVTKVIRKEYNSWFLYFSGLVLLLFYKGMTTPGIFLILMALLVLLYGMVKYLKYNKMLQ